VLIGCTRNVLLDHRVLAELDGICEILVEEGGSDYKVERDCLISLSHYLDLNHVRQGVVQDRY
jgi:hypothetical protein